MKKLQALICALICMIVISCNYNDHNIDIAYSEYDHYYSMKAHFPKNRTRDVEEYMDSRIGNSSNMSFTNSRIDGTIALDDHTKFYIKKYPGVLEIKLDKAENSEDAYHQIKSMCQGIKKVLAR